MKSQGGVNFAVAAVALALGACSGAGEGADEVAARIASDAKGAVARRGIPPVIGVDLKVASVSLEPTGAVLVEQNFCIFKDALGPCAGGDGWRRFEIRIDPEKVDAESIGLDKVAPGWGDGLMVVLPCRKDSDCIEGPGEPDKDLAPGDFINHYLASAAAEMWAKQVISSRHGTDNNIDPWAKSDPFKLPDQDYMRLFEAASPESGPAALPCSSQKACVHITKNAKRLIAAAIKRKAVIRRASVDPDTLPPTVKPSVNLTDLAKNIAKDEMLSRTDAEIDARRRAGPEPLEPVDIDVMAKPAPRDKGKPGPDVPLESPRDHSVPAPVHESRPCYGWDCIDASAETLSEILAKIEKNRNEIAKQFGELIWGGVADIAADGGTALRRLRSTNARLGEDGALIVSRTICKALLAPHVDQSKECAGAGTAQTYDLRIDLKQVKPATVRIRMGESSLGESGAWIVADCAGPGPCAVFAGAEPPKPIAVSIGDDPVPAIRIPCDVKRCPEAAASLKLLAGGGRSEPPPSSRGDADRRNQSPRGGSADEILARVNAAIKGRYILFTANFGKELRGQYMAPAFFLKDGALASERAGGALPYAIDLTKLGADSVGTITQDDGGAEFYFLRDSDPPGESFFVHLQAEGVLPFPQGGQFILQGEYGIYPPDDATGPKSGVKLTDIPKSGVKLTDITFECGTKAACEAFADDLRALIDAVNAARAYGVDIAGRWELYAPSPAGGFSRWVLDFRRDGSYVFTDESNGASHAGRYNSSAGKWSLSGKWTKNPILAPGTPFADDGAYSLIAADTLVLKGRYGAGVWRKAADR
ncbi:MAG: hypothetical protein ACK4NP_15090 [Parvularculaceae bacterium]